MLEPLLRISSYDCWTRWFRLIYHELTHTCPSYLIPLSRLFPQLWLRIDLRQLQIFSSHVLFLQVLPIDNLWRPVVCIDNIEFLTSLWWLNSIASVRSWPLCNGPCYSMSKASILLPIRIMEWNDILPYMRCSSHQLLLRRTSSRWGHQTASLFWWLICLRFCSKWDFFVEEIILSLGHCVHISRVHFRISELIKSPWASLFIND